ncbi:MAG: hypothetical protein KGL39_32795 [Patescibacteria group bacterium]|nr:hypothetical protein [Patescibacteria group bacterium]
MKCLGKVLFAVVAVAAVALMIVGIVLPPCPAGPHSHSPEYQTALQILQREICDAHGLAVEALTEERVLDLPEDGNQWHTILILRQDWQSQKAERRAEAAFHSEPLLVSLKHQTHWHLITTDQVEFKKFRSLVDVTPCLIIERANGEVIYRESGPELGKRPHGLVKAIRKDVERHCPDGRCLPLHPVPAPDGKDQANVDEVPAVLKDDTAPPEKKSHSALPAVAIATAALGAGFWRKFRTAAFV